MKSTPRTWWALFIIGSAVTFIALSAVSFIVLDLEARERHARADAAHQESVRLALWRMDSWLSPLIARESARPPYEFRPFYSQDRAYTRILNQIPPGEVLTPSPLLSLDSEYFLLHFQIEEDGDVTSPQVPTGNYLDLAQAEYVDVEAYQHNQDRLDSFAHLVSVPDIDFQVTCSEVRIDELEDTPLNTAQTFAQEDSIDESVQSEMQKLKSQIEWNYRAERAGSLPRQQSAQTAPQTISEDDPEQSPEIGIGPLVPVWLGQDTASEWRLLFVRRAHADKRTFYQGVLTDWPRIRARLLEEIADLFPDASLAPIAVEEIDAHSGEHLLAMIPAKLDVAMPAAPVGPLITPPRVMLAVTWLIAALALLLAGFALRSAIAFGERRNRFASAVTHELRTPLTTFRMYSEMLADGMVSDEAQRQTYLNTLRQESGRLTNLVESVMAYARLEQGGPHRRIRETSMQGLLDQFEEGLRQRAHECGMSFDVSVNVHPDATLETDVDAVGQVLFNLVDNACKYAGDSEEKRIDLNIARDNGELSFSIRDYGRGIPQSIGTALFQPFERDDQGDPNRPGVGLGLALSRGLAEDLGGTLQLIESSSEGATFELRVPMNCPPESPRTRRKG